MKLLIIIAVLILSGCGVRRYCTPSKNSKDYAVIRKQDKIYH